MPDDVSKDILEIGLRELFHLPRRRLVQLEEVTEDLGVGTNAVVHPLRRVRLARRLPLAQHPI